MKCSTTVAPRALAVQHKRHAAFPDAHARVHRIELGTLGRHAQAADLRHDLSQGHQTSDKNERTACSATQPLHRVQWNSSAAPHALQRGPGSKLSLDQGQIMQLGLAGRKLSASN